MRITATSRRQPYIDYTKLLRNPGDYSSDIDQLIYEIQQNQTISLSHIPASWN